MSGFASHAGLPHGTIPADQVNAVVKPYLSQLAEGSQDAVLAVEFQTYDDDDGLEWNYFGTDGFSSAATDTPASTPFTPAVSGSVSVSRSIPVTGYGAFAGLASQTFGEILFANPAGALDAISEKAVDGRRVIVKAGIASRTSSGKRRIVYSDLGTLIQARGDGWTHDGNFLRLGLQDSSVDLRSPIQRRRYAGTGEDEGTEDLEDKTRPLAFGKVYNVTPVLVDPNNFIYQVHDGYLAPIDGIPAVYDGGLALDGDVETVAGGFAGISTAASVPEAGYLVSLDGGYFRLHSRPINQVTCDVRGAVLSAYYGYEEPWSDGTYFDDGTGWVSGIAAHGYGEKLGEIILAILTICASWNVDRINIDSLKQLNRIQPASMGIYVPSGDEPSVADVIEALCQGCGAFAYADSQQRFALGRISEPRTATPITLDDVRIISIERLDLPYRVPPLGFSVRYKRNWTVQRASDLLGAVQEDLERVQDLAAPFRTANFEDLTRKTKHPTARIAEPVESYFVDQDDAYDEAVRLAALYAPGRQLYEVSTHYVSGLTLGRTIRAETSRHGLSAGRNFVIVGAREDFGAGTATVQVFG